MSNVYIVGGQKKRRKSGQKKYLRLSQILQKEIKLLSHIVKGTPSRIKYMPKKYMPRHIIIKLKQTEDKQEIFKVVIRVKHYQQGNATCQQSLPLQSCGGQKEAARHW